MALAKQEKFDLKAIQQEFNISQKSIDNSPIPVSELEKIWDDFQRSRAGDLERIRGEILLRLDSRLAGRVHSIKSRIKDPKHLIEKIIRNSNQKPKKYAFLNVDNYHKIITDLIGIRIIILDKKDWREVHNSLLKIFRNLPERYVKTPEDIIKNYDKYDKEANEEEKEWENSYHAEKPIVYITSVDDRELYVDESLEIDNSKTHYRSIHYIIRYKFIYFEIQVRTFFEEGWLEFDHRIKYPYDQHNRKKQEYADILGNLAFAADRLISFYDEADFKQEKLELADHIDDTAQQEADSKTEKQKEQTLRNKMKLYF